MNILNFVFNIQECDNYNNLLEDTSLQKLLKKQLIEMRQDQYVIKNAYRKPIYCMNLIKSFSKINLDEKIILSEEKDVYSTGVVNLFDTKHISALLCNYSKLKEDTWSNFHDTCVTTVTVSIFWSDFAK